MNFLVLLLICILLVVIIIQLGKVRNLAAAIRGEEVAERQNNDRTAVSLVIFMIVFLIFCIFSALYYKNSMLGYGPHEAASLHGVELDSLFNWTLFFTGIVFVLTQIALFWYAYVYRQRDNAEVYFFVHSSKLEIIWTMVPAIVMTFLVVQGLMVWNDVMFDVGPDDEFLEIEATGYQFAWDIRYPGADGVLGEKYFKKIDMAVNPLGLDWSDDNIIDDVVLSGADEIVLPVNTQIRVRITAKDVLHNFYLPQFRVKMDAIPGLPTYFIFTPTKTTEEYKQELKKYPEYNLPYDPEDPESLTRWEEFNYELACAELCGIGHYSMRRIVRIVSMEEYEEWASGLQSTYLSTIRNTENDPRKGELLNIEIKARAKVLSSNFDAALSKEESSIINLDHVFFETGSSILKDVSKYELDNLAQLLVVNGDVNIELGGHTDNVGDEELNKSLSDERAKSVAEYLKKKGIDNGRIRAVGYGESSPIEGNDTAEGRAANRRTECKIIK